VPGAAEPVDPPVPVVSLRVRVPATAAPGQDLEYRFLVENNSRAAAHHVLVRYPKPANVEVVRAVPEPTDQKPELVWKLGSLEPGMRKEIVVTVKPTGDGDVQACARVQFEHGQCVRTRISRPGLRVRLTGPERASVNEAVFFVAEVSNTGATEAADVVLTDTLPDGITFLNSKPSTPGDNPLTWNLGKIPPGQTRRVEFQVSLTRAGTFTNRAEVTGAGGLKQSTEATIAVTEPKLTVSVQGPRARVVRQEAMYQITVSNPTKEPFKGVRVVDDLVPEVDFVRASDKGQKTGDKVQWEIGTLAPGTRKTVSVVLSGKREGRFVNVIAASAEGVKEEETKATTDFKGTAGLTLVVEKGQETLEAERDGSFIAWVVNLTNAPATNVSLTVTAAGNLKLSEAGPDNPAVRFDPVPLLAPEREVSFRVPVRGLKPGDGSLHLELKTDQLRSAQKAEEKVKITEKSSLPGLELNPK
jgi:uncharacterized repeat protein (TIGR01451 family)